MTSPTQTPIVRKLEQRSDPAQRGLSLAAVQKREVLLYVEAESLENMKKQATVYIENPKGSTFQIICDEGAYLGGDDSAPPPLAYYSASIAFCLLTQLSRYASIRKLDITKMRLSQETRFAMEGSVAKGTLAGRGVELVTHVEVESSEPEETIREMLRVSENSCFVVQSIVSAVPSRIDASLNGKPMLAKSTTD